MVTTEHKGVKKYKCEEFLYYGKEMNKLAIMLPKANGHETSSKEMTWKENLILTGEGPLFIVLSKIIILDYEE